LVGIEGLTSRNNLTVWILETNNKKVIHESSKIKMEEIELSERKKEFCCFKKQNGWDFEVILKEK